MDKSHTNTQPLPHPTYKPCIHHGFEFQQSIGAETGICKKIELLYETILKLQVIKNIASLC